MFKFQDQEIKAKTLLVCMFQCAYQLRDFSIDGVLIFGKDTKKNSNTAQKLKFSKNQREKPTQNRE